MNMNHTNPAETPVTVWHQTDPHRRRAEITPRLTPSHKVAYEYTVDLTRSGATNYVKNSGFRANSHVDGSSCEIVPEGTRSLSVGDILQIGTIGYLVRPSGWTMLTGLETVATQEV